MYTACVILLCSCSCVHWLYIQQWCVIVNDLASFIHSWVNLHSIRRFTRFIVLLPTLLLSPFLFFSASHTLFYFYFLLLYLSWGLRTCQATLLMLRSQRFVRTIISYESPCFSTVFPNFYCLKIVRTAFVAVRNGICDRGFISVALLHLMYVNYAFNIFFWFHLLSV